MDNEGPSNCSLPCSSNTALQTGVTPAPIRKRRFSSAKIQPTRVKKVMQSDDEIGRMVASVPVAIGRAMEHFAEKLLEAAAVCVHCSTSRTLSPAHMKQAMLQYRHFAFLEPLMRDIQLPGRSGTEVIWHPDQLDQAHFQQMQFQQLHFQQPQLTASVPLIVPGPTDYAEFLSMQIPQIAAPQQLNAQLLNQQTNHLGQKRKQSNGSTEAPADGRPRRGRPRKIRKEDKCIDEEKIFGEIKKDTNCTPPVEARTSNGFPLSDSELMPPPTMLPLRIKRMNAAHAANDSIPQMQWHPSLPPLQSHSLPQSSDTAEKVLPTSNDQTC